MPIAIQFLSLIVVMGAIIYEISYRTGGGHSRYESYYTTARFARCPC